MNAPLKFYIGKITLISMTKINLYILSNIFMSVTKFIFWCSKMESWIGTALQLSFLVYIVVYLCYILSVLLFTEYGRKT